MFYVLKSQKSLKWIMGTRLKTMSGIQYLVNFHFSIAEKEIILEMFKRKSIVM